MFSLVYILKFGIVIFVIALIVMMVFVFNRNKD